MKKTIIALTILLMMPLSVSAQGNSTDADQKKADKEARQQERVGERVEQAIARMSAKIDARLNRYESFMGKVQTKRNLLDDQGADVTEVDRLIRVAETQLLETKNEVNSLLGELNSIDKTLTPREISQVVTGVVREVRVSFRDLHQSMVNIVKEMSTLVDTLEADDTI